MLLVAIYNSAFILYAAVYTTWPVVWREWHASTAAAVTTVATISTITTTCYDTCCTSIIITTTTVPTRNCAILQSQHVRQCELSCATVKWSVRTGSTIEWLLLLLSYYILHVLLLSCCCCYLMMFLLLLYRPVFVALFLQFGLRVLSSDDG